MKKLFKKFRHWYKAKVKAISPGKNAVKGAAYGLLLLSFLLFVLAAVRNVILTNDSWIIVFLLCFVLGVILLALINTWLIKKIAGIPRMYKLALFIAIPLLVVVFAGEGLYITVGILLFSLLGAGLAVVFSGRFREKSTTKKTITITGLLLAIATLIVAFIGYSPDGFEMDPIVNAAALNADAIKHIDAASPAQNGSYNVVTLTYGSGKDKHRPEFGEKVSITTDSVNGVAFLDDWDGFGGWYREQYWGFDDTALPLNGYVWYPQGEGPFPMALIVHGNHGMQDYSDVGYAYLGELLASRGIIVASVDENFLNGSWSDIIGGLDDENDARAWLLLEHLRQWHDWNASPESPFYQKVDTTKIALIGHSRGGEAVGHAALLNKTPLYVDDASIPLDYNFDIQSIVAIAPVDGQYQPANTRSAFKDINYLVLHGSQDGDVTSYSGSRQYERIQFTDSTDYFKSGIYIQGANHGQFNTSWGNNDTGLAPTKFLNLSQLLTAQDQQQIAKVYISAFLEHTLKGNKVYKPLFTDARTARQWLPSTIYLSQYQDASFRPIATFDEDFDVTTSSEAEGIFVSENLSVWREQEIPLKYGKKGSRAAYVGWYYDLDQTDSIAQPVKNQNKGSIPDSIVARYTLRFDQIPLAVDSTAVLTFALAESTENTNPKDSGKWVRTNNNANNNASQNNNISNSEAANNEEMTDASQTQEADVDDQEEAEEPIDFSIVIRDSHQNELRFALSDFSALQREIQTRVWKSEFITGEKASEHVFQTFRFPLSKYLTSPNNFDTNQIKSISFVFDHTQEGVIIIDHLGFTQSLEH
ncbi:MAG: hypothetical protein ABNH00_05475 [Dokdonia sp.]|jgi:dienelactone hydrolase